MTACLHPLLHVLLLLLLLLSSILLLTDGRLMLHLLHLRLRRMRGLPRLRVQILVLLQEVRLHVGWRILSHVLHGR